MNYRTISFHTNNSPHWGIIGYQEIIKKLEEDHLSKGYREILMKLEGDVDQED